jgi:hypothetical protein
MKDDINSEIKYIKSSFSDRELTNIEKDAIGRLKSWICYKCGSRSNCKNCNIEVDKMISELLFQ